jgi:hypothetical protein
MPFPGRDSDVEVINSWSADDISLTRRRGTLASGKQRKARYAIDIKSEPLLFELDELNLGNKPAEAWAQRIRDNVIGISAVASKATQALRVKGAIALAAGASWATKRYSGGRIGTMQPNQTDKLFNDSGRLAKSIHMRPNLTDSSYTINVAANRFNPDLFGAGFEVMMNKFVTLVPMLDPKKAFADPDIEKAIKEGLADMMTKAESNAEAALASSLARLRGARLKVVAQLARAAAEALGL